MRVPTLEYFEWQRGVLSIEDSPPESPSHGDSYLIGTGADAWAGQDNKIALYDTSGWVYIAPVKGMFCFVKDVDKLYYYVTSWEEFSSGGGGSQCVLYSAVGTTDISISSGDFSDMTNMSITENFSAGDVLIMFNATCRFSGDYVNNKSQFKALIDDVEKDLQAFSIAASANARHIVSIILKATLTEDEHTIKIQWAKGGIGTLYQEGATYPRKLLVVGGFS